MDCIVFKKNKGILQEMENILIKPLPMLRQTHVICLQCGHVAESYRQPACMFCKAKVQDFESRGIELFVQKYPRKTNTHKLESML
jgi:hypothetical protein